MFNYDNIRFIMDNEGNVSIRMDKDHNVWEKNEFGREISKARYVWFYFLKSEWDTFVRARYYSNVFTDIGHRLDVSGDICLFYDINIPRNDHGKMEISFQKFSFPIRARKIIHRYLRLYAYLKGFDDSDRVDVSMSPERLRKLYRRYGTGTGIVKVDMDPETKTRLVKDIAKDRKLAQNIRSLVWGCKNSTSRFNETATLNLFKDGHSYYFLEKNKNGKTMVNGGIINHGTEDKPDWSVHT